MMPNGIDIFPLGLASAVLKVVCFVMNASGLFSLFDFTPDSKKNEHSFDI